VAYRPLARQGPRNKQVQPLLCNRQINKRPFLSNGSTNTFPRKRICKQQYTYCWKRGVFYVVLSEELKRRELGQPVQFSFAREPQKRRRHSWVDSWQEICSGGCDNRTWAREAEESPLLGDVAMERLFKTQQARKCLAAAVVMCKVWRLMIAL
jgi:hypothetical protein